MQFYIKASTAYHPVIQEEVMKYYPTDGAGFTQMYLWILNVLLVYDPFIILSNSIVTCTYLL